MWLGLSWAKHSLQKHKQNGEAAYLGEDREHLVVYSKKYLEAHPDIDFFIYGHRHIQLDLPIGNHSRILILGDWISQFTYAVFDGEELYMEQYIEGETKP